MENKHVRANKKMNYINYERKIVEDLGVALIGWPEGGKIKNSGNIGIDMALELREALEKKECRWVVLTLEEKKDRKRRNAQREQDGEMVYGPPRKKRAKRSAPENEEQENSLQLK